MNINNESLRSLIEEWSSAPFSREEHFNSFEAKSAPFLDHIVPKALRLDPINGEVWLKNDMQLIFSKPVLWATIQGELIRLMGYDGAKAVLYEAGFRYGFEDAKSYLEYMAKSLNQPTPYFNDILYASMGWGIFQTMQFDLEKSRLHLRAWNRAEVNIFKKLYGTQEHPICLLIQGFNAGICCTIFQRKMRSIETKCVAKGDPYCEFFSFPEEEYGITTVTDKLRTSLDTLKRVDGVLACAVVSSQGHILGSAFRSDVKENKVATMTATIFSIAKQAGIELQQGQFNNVFVDSDEGYLAMTNIGTEAVLVALTSKKVPIGSIILKLKRAAQEIVAKKLLK
ncbi:roadblock/LC7 domain-containing protein [candidate division KSB1 bacterium]|nr:roadblock/LC7 domain-containing protein [candidate division KSB1 bacterium]